MDPTKVTGLGEWPQEIKNVKGAHSFIGVIGYHRMFIPNFSEIAAPITKLFSKDMDFTWGPEQHAAQEELIYRITHTPVLV